MKKVIIFSAPSGSGKSTIINYLLGRDLGLEFSISATSRQPRGTEKHACEYYFFSQEEFKKRIDNNEFLEWEEVYSGCYYGTLKSELDRIWEKNHIVLFDVDVVGGVNIKKIFKENALAIFIQPPSIEILRERLEGRGTDSPEKIDERISKAEFEMGFAHQFDAVIVNEDLKTAEDEVEQAIIKFISHHPAE
ncbi:guanylate kinase [Porphyromonadaceae bacterium OttesenSCG-928-L07]|nr:guanylate kinase [Porphyromonadaceae bacterium OttesenSCG-928-L07]